MSSIPGSRFDITGASGSHGFLSPQNSWRVYVLPQGGYASQDSTGTVVTFDSSEVASRFAANQWVQVGLATANIRQVTGVGGNSIGVNTAVTVAENDRVFLIGATQPTVTGGSATYTVPASFIYQRDDDTADRYTNSMVTTNANGLVQFFAQPNTFDAIIQDSNRSNQGSIVDLEVGSSSITVSVFGATVTMNAGVGVTGHAVFANTVTIGGALGVTGTANIDGWARFGSTVTMNANAGVTGSFTFGLTLTSSGATFSIPTWPILGVSATFQSSVGITGSLVVGGTMTTSGSLIFGQTLLSSGATFSIPKWPLIGVSLTVDGGLGVTGSAIIGSSVDIKGHLTTGRIKLRRGTTHTSTAYTLGASWGTATVSVSTSNRDTAGIVVVTVTNDTSGGANPGLTLTYVDGAWEEPPVVIVANGTTSSSSSAGEWRVAVSGTSQFILRYTALGAPAVSTYKFNYLVFGSS